MRYGCDKVISFKVRHPRLMAVEEDIALNVWSPDFATHHLRPFLPHDIGNCYGSSVMIKLPIEGAYGKRDDLLVLVQAYGEESGSGRDSYTWSNTAENFCYRVPRYMREANRCRACLR